MPCRDPGSPQHPPGGHRQCPGHRRGRQLVVLVGEDLHRHWRRRPGGEQGAQEAVQVEVALARCAAVAGALVEVVVGDWVVEVVIGGRVVGVVLLVAVLDVVVVVGC